MRRTPQYPSGWPNKSRPNRAPALTLREFAESIKVDLKRMVVMFKTAKKLGVATPRPFARNSTLNTSYYAREDLTQWWDKMKGKDPLTCKTIDSSDPSCSNVENNQGETKMPDIKSELAKVITQWSDEAPSQEADQEVTSYTHRIFNWLKKNPSSTAAEATAALSIIDPTIPKEVIAKTLYTLVHNGAASKVPFTKHVPPFGPRTHYRYHTLIEQYPVTGKGRPRVGKSAPKVKVKPKHELKRTDKGLASLFAINNGEGAQGISHGNSHAVQAAAKPSVESYLDTLSVNEAFQLYQRLKDMFDAK